MPAVFKFAYSLAVALLFVLAVVMGTRTFYEEPEQPIYPPYPAVRINLECDFSFGQCILHRPDEPQEVRLSLSEARASYPDDFRALERQVEVMREYEAAEKKFHDDEVERSRNVLLMVSISGVVAIAAGLYLFPRVEAIPLGLMLGGLGVIVYGWIESRHEAEEIAAAPVFVAATVGSSSCWLWAIGSCDRSVRRGRRSTAVRAASPAVLTRVGRRTRRDRAESG